MHVLIMLLTRLLHFSSSLSSFNLTTGPILKGIGSAAPQLQNSSNSSTVALPPIPPPPSNHTTTAHLHHVTSGGGGGSSTLHPPPPPPPPLPELGPSVALLAGKLPELVLLFASLVALL